MRIGILLTGFDGGGTQRRLLTLADAFLARGHEVDLVVGRDGGAFRKRAPDRATIVSLHSALHRLPGLLRRKTLRMLVAVPGLARYVHSGRIDVLLCGSPPANIAGLLARGIARSALPVVLCVNVPLSTSSAARNRTLLTRLVRRFYPQADAVIANAVFLADDVVRMIGLPRDRVTTISNPIDIADIERGMAEPVSHPWLDDAAVPVLLAVGKLKVQKDYPTLLRAFREVLDVRPARLLFLGAGEQHGPLLQLSAELGLSGHVAFAGFVANPFPFMSRAGALVSSSRWEGFSNVVAEALACGCAVVATDCPGGVAETLDGGRVGRLVAVGDFRAMARAILETLDDPPDRRRLRDRAAQFSVARAAEAYLDVLRRCVAARASLPHRSPGSEPSPTAQRTPAQDYGKDARSLSTGRHIRKEG